MGSEIRETRKNGEPGFHGKILESDPPSRLVFTFIVPGGETTKVSYDIESQGEMVTFKITHVGNDRDSKEYKSTSIGWAAIVSGIKTLLETGKTLDKDSVSDLF